MADVVEFRSFDTPGVMATGPWTTPDGEIPSLLGLFDDQQPKRVAPGVVRFQGGLVAAPSLRLARFLVFVGPDEAYAVANAQGDPPIRLRRTAAD